MLSIDTLASSPHLAVVLRLAILTRPSVAGFKRLLTFGTAFDSLPHSLLCLRKNSCNSSVFAG